eukprot:2788783-Pyramimonas_sp.AAC.1
MTKDAVLHHQARSCATAPAADATDDNGAYPLANTFVRPLKVSTSACEDPSGSPLSTSSKCQKNPLSSTTSPAAG